MNKQKIALLTDSGTNTPAAFAAEHDIRVAPLLVTCADGTTYRSGVDLQADQLVRILAHETPKTSLPTPQIISDLLEQARADGYERAVFVTIAAGLSATYQAVNLVASQRGDFDVTVVDSRSIGVAAGLVVMEAARMIEQDVPFRKIGRLLDDVVDRTWVFFSTTTLEYLYRGGRISQAVYRLGEMLDIKPVITCNRSGHYVVARKSRGWERSLTTEVSLAQAKARAFDRVRLAICCSDSVACFDQMEERLRAALDEVGVEVCEVVRSDVSPDLLVHTGPDLVGVGVQGII